MSDDKINEAFSKVRESFYDLCEAEAALKKARRRAMIARTIEKTVLIVIVGTVANKTINRKK